MKARLVRIGNSRGLRLPKAFIEQARLGDEVELELHDESIVISRSASPRQDWAEAAARAAQSTEGELLDAPVETRFDREEWRW